MSSDLTRRASVCSVDRKGKNINAMLGQPPTIQAIGVQGSGHKFPREIPDVRVLEETFLVKNFRKLDNDVMTLVAHMVAKVVVDDPR